MRFLSGEWLEHVSAVAGGHVVAAAAATPAPRPEGPAGAVSIHQRVTGGPDGDVEYTLRLDRGAVRIEPGPGPADVEIVQDYATAAAISQGTLSPAAAFAAGRLRLTGDVGVLVANQEVVAALGPRLAGLSDQTTY